MNRTQPLIISAVVTAAMTLTAGCSGLPSSAGFAPQPTDAATSVPQWQSMHLAHPVCPAPRVGEAQCYVIMLNKHVEPNVAGLTPADFQARYKLPSSNKGSGQIVAIVDAYDNPNVADDLNTYRSEFGLGAAKFHKYNQDGQQSNYPRGSPNWGVEIDLDAQMVSASCPLCTIYLVEANGADNSDLQTAEAEAVKLGAHIVSNSWGCTVSSSCVEQSYFDTPGVEYLASNGDSGEGQLSAPAAFDTVAAIGGTILSKSGSSYSEMIWPGSGGGCATGIPKPKWQHDKVCSGRAIGDASAVASNVALYDSYGYGGWATVGGTSVSSPLLAGVFGLAGNAAKQDGGRTFWIKTHRVHLYDVCGTSCLFKTYSYPGGWGSPDGIGAF